MSKMMQNSWIMNHKKTSIAMLVLLALLIVLTAVLTAINRKSAPLNSGIFGFINADDGIAIQGYDAVAYHTLRKAQPGSPVHAYSYLGVDWHFTSAENKQLFTNDPTAYAPKYGGFCAMSIHIGLTAVGDPSIWHIEDNQLYLFFLESNKANFIAQNPKEIIAKSDQNWAGAVPSIFQ